MKGVPPEVTTYSAENYDFAPQKVILGRPCGFLFEMIPFPGDIWGHLLIFGRVLGCPRKIVKG